MDTSPLSSPKECPLLVVTGPTSLVKSSSLLSNKRRSDTTDDGGPARLSDVMEHLASPTTHDEDTGISGALSDGELDLCAATNHRIVRSGRFTVHGSKVHVRPSVLSTDSDISVNTTLRRHKQLSVAESMTGSKAGSGRMTRKRTESKRPTRRISCKDLGSGQCQGWLMKKKEGSKSKSWAKRWFVLSRRSLYYYRTEEDERAEGVIYLPGFKISPAPEMKTKKFAFKAHHSGTTFYFAAERQDDMAKWMNKLGLASLDELELSGATLTAGFWKPPEMLPPVKSASHQDLSRVQSRSAEEFYSESDDDELSRRASPAHSKDDITALYRNIERADLDLAGSNVRDRRSTMLISVLNDDDDHRHDDMWRHLLSLNRTLKDRQQTLTAIDALLDRQPITSQHLADFTTQHPDVVGQQGGSLEDSEDLTRSADSDSVILSADTTGADTTADTTADTSANTTTDTSVADTTGADTTADTSAADTSSNTADGSNLSETTSLRHVSHSDVSVSSPTSLSPPPHKPRRPSQETSV